MITLSLVVLLSGLVANASAAPNPTGVSAQVLQITVFTGQGWIVDFYPDGRVHAQ